MKPLLPIALAVLVWTAVAALLPPEAARGLRLGFLVLSAPPLGAILLTAIARLTGADWSALAPIAAPAPLLIPLAALAMLVATPPPPPHLAVWAHSLFAAARAALAVGALALAAPRVARSEAAAAITLALYAALVTPVAADWLLGTEPGHPVSAAGMMLFVSEIAAACAALLVTGLGSERLRADMAKLLVAAMLGLCYLGYMDYLVVWYGNLPANVPFYVARTAFPAAFIALAGLLASLAAPIAALTLIGGEIGRRLAGGSALAAVALFAWWWLGGGLIVLLVAAFALATTFPALRGLTHG